MNGFEWKWSRMREHPLESIGVVLFLLGRYLFAAIFAYGFWHKLVKGWLWTDLMEGFFRLRLSELDPGTWQALYLEHFAIPLAMPIAWIVTVGELLVAVCLILGLAVRANAAFALFLFVNFTAGAYFNWSMPPLMLYAVLMMLLPSGHWLGLDRQLHLKHPDSPWFK
ncbi:DoxX family membrane protein [Chlorobium sp. N1]|uniref:DoxX family membrane protein n=1 Tax=Chlorobium sp. N1 TaxID=2491138 RepID=UPI00103D10C1|nr:DoxX family membrane protein [Chlorobium sp. N1]TCD48384.1 DoxX family membrane protein [Chlorobium sp. N1]